MFYVDDIFLKMGVYGIEDVTKNKIVYVGSTKNTFAERIGRHINDWKKGKHCNKELVNLFENNNYKYRSRKAKTIIS